MQEISSSIQTKLNVRLLMIKLKDGLTHFLVNENIDLETALKIKNYLKEYSKRIFISLKTVFVQNHVKSK